MYIVLCRRSLMWQWPCAQLIKPCTARYHILDMYSKTCTCCVQEEPDVAMAPVPMPVALAGSSVVEQEGEGGNGDVLQVRMADVNYIK